MRFITVQTLPTKQWTDKNGKHHIENCTFNEVTVKHNNEIGFSPMWAIPITTFKETLASMLIIAANYPNILCTFETEHYKIVDKIKHYNNIKNNKKIIPITTEKLPTHLTEYVLNISKLPELPDTMAFTDIKLLSSEQMISNVFNIHNKNLDPQFLQDTLVLLTRQIQKMPELTEESFVSIKNEWPETYEQRKYATTNWFYYKHLILPIILYGLCEDTNPDIKNGKIILNSTAVMSIMHDINKFIDLENKISHWSYNDCSKETFEKIYTQIKNTIIKDPITLSILASGQKPERNKPCPCGSNKKYKKCHNK